MPPSFTSFLGKRSLTLLLGFYGTAYAVALTCSRTFLFGYDAIVGLLIANATHRYHTFNTLFFPAVDDLAREQSVFVTWWTPGQYVFQLAAKTLLNLTYETSTKLLVWICLISGLAGYAALFRRLGFTQRTAFWAISYSGLFAFGTGLVDIYVGGDNLLWAYAPWFFSFALAGRANIGHGIALVAAAFLGFLLKAAFVPIALAGFLLFAYRRLESTASATGTISLRAWLHTGLVFTISSAIFLVFTRGLFLSLGPGISSISRPTGFAVRQFVFPLVAPLLSALQMPFINRTAEWLVLLPVALYMLIRLMHTSAARPNYRFLLLTTTAVYSVFFSMLYCRGYDVSYELRHFRFPAMLWIPIFFVWLSATSGIRRTTGIALLAIATLLGIGGTWKLYGREVPTGIVDSSTPGLLAGYHSESLTCLRHIDTSEPGLTLFLHPDLMRLALAIEHNDYFIIDNFICYQFDDGRMTSKILRHRRPQMALLVPHDYDQVSDPDRIFSRFADIPAWTLVQRTHDFVLYRAQELLPSKGDVQ